MSPATTTTKLHAVLEPYIAAMHVELIDYDASAGGQTPHFATDQSRLRQAGDGWLIVDRLIPVLPNIYPPASSLIDVPAIVMQITAEIQCIVALLDAQN
jgi:hypothetical protein